MTFFLISHVILCTAYGLWWFGINREESVYRFVLVLTVPIIGILLLLLLDSFVHKTIDIDNIGAFGIEKHVHRKNFVKLDIAKEINVVPFEEVLALNTNNMKRKFIIESLKKDIEECIVFLTKALQDEDTETSHYAASAIMEIRRKLTIALQEYSLRYQQDQTSFETVAGYAKILKKYLQSGLLDEISFGKYTISYGDVLTVLLHLPEATAEHYTDKINCCLAMKDYSQAAEVCECFSKAYPESEEPHLMKIKLFFTLRDKPKLDAALAAFRKSEIRFSNNALQMVRYWSEVNR
jgi:tetratricopeptide (TPR) repeat protein